MTRNESQQLPLMILGILPAVSTGLTIAVMLARRPGAGFSGTFVRALIANAAYIVLSTEILGLFRAVDRPHLLLAWAVPITLLSALIFHDWNSESRLPRPNRRIPKDLPWLIFLMSILLIVIVTALIAWIWQPNTWDSLRYHMPRVAHWAQERAVVHYATGIEVQNMIGPFAEFAVLHTYVLSGGDRWVNFIQWVAMLGSVLGSSHIARQLGGSDKAQYLAAALVAALPAGIAQATSTMTDYVVCFFIVASAIELLSIRASGVHADNLVFLGLSVGLSVGTKPTAYPYLLPFAVYALVLLVRRYRFVQIAVSSSTVLSIVLILNIGHMCRNSVTYGNPIGANSEVADHLNELRTVRGLASNLTRHASLHAGTPWEPINEFIYKGITKLHLILDLSMDDPRTTFIGPYMLWAPRLEETFAGNSVQAYLYLLALPMSLVIAKRFSGHTLIYGLLVISSFIVFSFVFKWQVFSSRFHLPFFVLFAPYVAIVLAPLMPDFSVPLLGTAVILLAWPWLFRLQNRPLADHFAAAIAPDTEAPLTEFLNLGSREYSGFKRLTNPIREAGCSRIAVMLSGNGREYPIWANLGAPREGLEIEWIVVGTPSEKHRDYDFEPCAAICQNCPNEWDEFREMPMVYDDGTHRLYLARGSQEK